MNSMMVTLTSQERKRWEEGIGDTGLGLMSRVKGIVESWLKDHALPEGHTRESIDVSASKYDAEAVQRPDDEKPRQSVPLPWKKGDVAVSPSGEKWKREKIDVWNPLGHQPHIVSSDFEIKAMVRLGGWIVTRPYTPVYIEGTVDADDPFKLKVTYHTRVSDRDGWKNVPIVVLNRRKIVSWDNAEALDNHKLRLCWNESLVPGKTYTVVVVDPDEEASE